MKLEKVAEAAAGAVLILFLPDDVATGGVAALAGAALIADAFGVKL